MGVINETFTPIMLLIIFHLLIAIAVTGIPPAGGSFSSEDYDYDSAIVPENDSVKVRNVLDGHTLRVAERCAHIQILTPKNRSLAFTIGLPVACSEWEYKLLLGECSVMLRLSNSRGEAKATRIMYPVGHATWEQNQLLYRYAFGGHYFQKFLQECGGAVFSSHHQGKSTHEVSPSYLLNLGVIDENFGDSLNCTRFDVHFPASYRFPRGMQPQGCRLAARRNLWPPENYDDPNNKLKKLENPTLLFFAALVLLFSAILATVFQVGVIMSG